MYKRLKILGAVFAATGSLLFGSSVNAFASTNSVTPPTYNGPWATAPLVSTKQSSQLIQPAFNVPCVVHIGNVDMSGVNLYVYGATICSSSSFEPIEVQTSIWRIRWWGGQQVAGYNSSGFQYVTTVDKNSAYLCANLSSTYSYYGVAYGYADGGAESGEVSSVSATTYTCG